MRYKLIKKAIHLRSNHPPKKMKKIQNRLVTFLPLILLVFLTKQSFSQDSLTTPKMLILGDSHLVGDFGEYLHRQMYRLDKFDITSIAIGGAGTVHFTMTMKNFCCGYKIRVSNKGEIVSDKSKFRLLEKQGVYTNEIVYKEYEGKLSKYLEINSPNIIILALGSNYVNAHYDLVDIIKKSSPDTKIIWVGPFLRENFQARIDPIVKVTGKYKIPLVRSDDIVGNDTLRTAHFYGRTASNWASKVSERLKPYLN